MINKLFFLILTSFVINFVILAKEVPALTSPIIDEVGIISSTTKNQIEKILYQLKETQKIQFQIFIVESLEDEDINSYSIKVVDKWKLGDQDSDKGLLFLLALRERKMRLEVGQGLEGDLTDLYSKRIIDSIKPSLKRADYDNAVALIVHGVLEKLQINSEELNNLPVKRKKVRSNDIVTIIIFIVVILISFFQRFFSVSGRHYRNRRDPFGYYGGGNHYGGGSSHSSGSSWGSGGGGFSGGGASGDW